MSALHQASAPIAPSYAPSLGVSVVIPAWNEEDRLPGALDKYLPLGKDFSDRFEVIVVADGVTDRTVDVAARYASRGVRLIRFDHRLGKGGAVISGLRAARFGVVGFVDADAPVTPDSIVRMWKTLENADAAIGSRRLPESAITKRPPVMRRFFSWGWNLLARLLLDLQIRDTQCGAKFFRAEPVLRVLPKVTLTNWAFDASLLFHLRKSGSTIVEVPVEWGDDPNTKLRLDRVVPAMFLSLIGIRLMNIRFLPRFTRAWAGIFFSQFERN